MTNYDYARDSLVLVGERRVVHELIARASESFGPAIALTDGSRNFRYADLPKLAESTACALKRLGVNSGDRVVVIAENCIETIQLLIACAWLGSILVPVNPLVRESQLKYFIDSIEPALIFIHKDVKDKWSNSSSQFLNDLIVYDLESEMKSAAISLGLVEDLNPDLISTPSDTLAILFTSGTTGYPKGVMCPNGQFITWGEVVGDFLKIVPGDVVYTCLPLFHTNSLNAFMQSLIHGGTYYLGERFSVSQFWQRMIDTQTSVTYLLGAMVSMLLSAPETPIEKESKVRTILAPGTPVKSWEEFERRFGVHLIEAHGMTETNAAIGPDGDQQKLGHMGRVVKGFEARIIDFDGNECPDGVPGELVLRTDIPDAFASGYWRLDEETEKANKGGWFHSGDRVVREDGWYKFLDRIKDLIRRRGENISAWEVEMALESLPTIAAAAVVAVPSELGEDEVMAFIVRKEGTDESPEGILDSCSDLLPYFALPRFIEFVPSLPLTENAKIRKIELRVLGVQPSTWDSQKAGYVAKR